MELWFLLRFTCAITSCYFTSLGAAGDKLTYQLEFPLNQTDPYAKLDGTIHKQLKQFTLCYWSKLTFDTKWWQYIFSYAVDPPSADYFYSGRHYGSKLVDFGLYNSPDIEIAHGASENKWLHICITWQTIEPKMEFFINGRLIKSQPTSRQIPFQPNGIVILGKYTPNTIDELQQLRKLVGEMSEVHLWDYILSPTQISEVYKCTFEDDGNVISWQRNSWSLYGGTLISPVKLPCGGGQ